MLVLSRKLNEQVVIDDDIIVTVIGIAGNRVRIGVEAPKEVPVHRREVWEKLNGAAIIDGFRFDVSESPAAVG